MSNYATRLDRLGEAIRPAADPLHILRAILDSAASGDQVVEVLARGENGSLTTFVREPGESKEALCKRARVAMGWVS